jgi:hypothetical protein
MDLADEASFTAQLLDGLPRLVGFQGLESGGL